MNPILFDRFAVFFEKIDISEIPQQYDDQNDTYRVNQSHYYNRKDVGPWIVYFLVFPNGAAYIS